MDTLSAEQATEIYQLAAECQTLGSKLTKQFQNLSRFEAMNRAAAQAAVHETINAGHMIHSATFGVATDTQTDQECESSLHRLCTKANQAWKDANKVIFSHLLRYDSQLAAFISTAEGTLQAKCDEIWRCIHSLADTANIPHTICLPLALQTLDQLPPIPWDLSYHAGIALMFTYGPESYNFQTWSAAGDGDYLLDNEAQATNQLSCKLVCMAGRAGPDDPSPIRAASPAGLASSAAPLSPAHSPSRSCSRTPNHETESDSVSQEDSESEEKDEADSDGRVPGDSEGSGSGSSDAKDSGDGSKILDVDGQEEDSDGETDESNSEAEGSDAKSSSSSLESDDEIPTKATPPMKKTPGSNPNTSQMLSLPDLDSKDSKWKIKWHRDAHLLDEKFGKWQDHMICKGHNEWNTHDTMTCDHMDPCKEAKFPDPISLPLEYMKHYRVFNPKKTNEYDLCCFYQVGLSRDLPDFPSPCEPATHEQVSKFLLKDRALGWPNLIMEHPSDSVIAVCLLQELHVKDSL